MFKFIQKAYGALPQDTIDEEVSKIENKCKIEGYVINYKRDLIKDNPCFAKLELIVKNKENYYKFDANGLGNSDCTIDAIYEVFGRNIKIGEKLYVLADKDNRIISSNLYGYNKYDVKYCESNYSDKRYELDYLGKSHLMNSKNYLIFGFIIFILLVIFYKLIKMNKKS